jgi:hypothetical protein
MKKFSPFLVVALFAVSAHAKTKDIYNNYSCKFSGVAKNSDAHNGDVELSIRFYAELADGKGKITFGSIYQQDSEGTNAKKQGINVASGRDVVLKPYEPTSKFYRDYLGGNGVGVEFDYINVTGKFFDGPDVVNFYLAKEPFEKKTRPNQPAEDATYDAKSKALLAVKMHDQMRPIYVQLICEGSYWVTEKE